MTETASRDWELEQPYDLVGTMRALADSASDPTWHVDEAGDATLAVRAMWTADGPTTVEFRSRRRPRGATTELTATAYGPGANWVAGRADWMAGLHDDPAIPAADVHPVVLSAARGQSGVLMARSLSLWDVVVPTVLGQRVTKAEAHRSWRGLVAGHGSQAPGPHDVRLAPSPRSVLDLGDAHWHTLGVERRRADAVRGIIRRLDTLERVAGPPQAPDVSRTSEFRRVAETIPGVGEWTSTALAAAVLGDPDVVLLGDLHLPNGICFALAGEHRGSDERMLELLEPFRPHRGRVTRLLKTSGMASAPRRGPRYNPLPIAEM